MHLGLYLKRTEVNLSSLCMKTVGSLYLPLRLSEPDINNRYEQVIIAQTRQTTKLKLSIATLLPHAIPSAIGKFHRSIPCAISCNPEIHKVREVT